jgi:hypothetical protein
MEVIMENDKLLFQRDGKVKKWLGKSTLLLVLVVVIGIGVLAVRVNQEKQGVKAVSTTSNIQTNGQVGGCGPCLIVPPSKK